MTAAIRPPNKWRATYSTFRNKWGDERCRPAIKDGNQTVWIGFREAWSHTESRWHAKDELKAIQESSHD